MPSLDGVLETALYVDDPARSEEFYRRVFEFDTISSGDRLVAMSVLGRQVLLLFKKGGSSGLEHTPHDGDGRLHLAFAISASELETWRSWLEKQGIIIEFDKTWPRGGRSLYFRDPDGHLLELATPGVWSIY